MTHQNAKERKTPNNLPFILARIINIALLLLAFNQLPYDYYTFLRLITCGVTGYGIYFAFQLRKMGWAWVFGVIAFLFNPVFPVHLDRNTWRVIDAIVAVVLFVSLFQLKERGKRNYAKK